MKTTRRLAFLAASLPLAAHAAEPLRIDASPAFLSSDMDTRVLRVDVQNDGKATQGVLQIQNVAGPVSYPVDLPRGARRSFIVPSDRPDEIRLTLRTDEGTVLQRLRASIPYDETGKRMSFAYIGSSGAGLSFAKDQSRTAGPLPSNAFREAFARPANAPGRAFAYQGFDAVMLGPGAEKMDDRAVAALRTYAMSGGTVMVFGGTSAPVLRDARWTDVLPGRDWGPQRRRPDGPASPEHEVQAPGELAPGARAKDDVYSRGYGLGRVVVLGFSPNDPALEGLPAFTKTALAFAQNERTAQARELVNAYQAGEGGQDYTSGLARRASILLPMPSTQVASFGGSGSDPFRARLPSSTGVFGLLALYFVLVVPGSYFVLRRMKRAEWAWATAPLLALGFAGLLFRSAQGLYAARLSTATSGLVVMQEGTPDALFFGRSQLFIPQGGVYDLGLKGVDSMVGTWNRDYAYWPASSSEGLQGFNLEDDGTLRAPRLEASSLSFREMSYQQSLGTEGGFQSRRVDTDHLLVENKTPWTFQGRVVSGRAYGEQIELAPGSKRVVALGEWMNGSGDSKIARDPANYTAASGRIALSGSLQGLRPGPQLGDLAAERSQVAVLAFLKETVR